MAENSLSLPASDRVHEFDAFRSVLMLLGVVLHAANPYTFGSRWLVYDPHGDRLLNEVTDFIHVFRMPAFFLVSGYFSMLLLCRWPTLHFLKDRVHRIGVPLLATLLTVNLFQAWFLYLRHPQMAPDFGRALALQWFEGLFVGHLWFLVILLFFCLAAVACAPALRTYAKHLQPDLIRRHASLLVYMLLGGMVCFTLAVALLNHLLVGRGLSLNVTVIGLFVPEELLEYFPYFALGLALQPFPELMATFSRPGWIALSMGALALGLSLGSLELAAPASGVLQVIVASVLVWTVLRLLFALFHRVAAKPSATFRYLSGASYTIYLLHHLPVVVLATWMIPLPWHSWMKFTIYLVLATGISLCVHHFLILRIPLLGYLFNGKRMARTRATDSAAVQPSLARDASTP